MWYMACESISKSLDFLTTCLPMTYIRKFIHVTHDLFPSLYCIFQSDHFLLSTNFLFKFNVSLPLVTGELLQNTVDVNNVTYKLYNIKLQRLPVLLNTKNDLSTGQAIT